MSSPRPPLNRRCHVCGYRYEASLDECPADKVPLDRPTPGVDCLGSYRLIERLAVGGMGAVYRAINEKIGRSVAVKLLHQSLRGEVVSVSRFFTEARAVNTIRHPNVVEVYDFSGEGEDVYMVLELLRGQDLRTVLGSEPMGFLPPERVVSILEQVCGALQATHLRKIVHRDLKPENVFLIRRPNGSDLVKLLDFGVAKLERPEGKLTRDGIALGTPEYMAPEQARAIHVDGRTDVYAVGCIAFEMLTGRTLFHGASPGDIMIKQVREAPPSLRSLNPQVPPALEAVVLRCLAKSPKDRPQSAMELARELCAAIGVRFDASGAFENWKSWDGPSGTSMIEMPAVEVAAPNPARATSSWANRRRRTMHVFLGAAAAFALAGLTIMGVRAGQKARDAESVAAAAPPVAAAPAAPTSRAMTVRSVPTGAEVFDPSGQRLGVTPLRLELPVGLAVSLQFTHAGYEPTVRQVRADLPDQTLEVQLAPNEQRLTQTGRAGRRVR
ncbi:MAG TPA: serine/threonine-protein kinase [Polyangia bacterium]